MQLFGGGDLSWWVAEVLAEPAQRFMLRSGVDEGGWRGPPLSDAEASGLRWVLETGLVSLDAVTGTVTGHFDRAKPYQLFVPYDGGRLRPGRVWSWNWQESLTQLTFAAELVCNHGWLPEKVALELGALDIGAGNEPRSHPLVAAEVKRRDTGRGDSLESMLAVFAELAGGREVVVSRDIRKNASAKYAQLLLLRPPVFCGVAPGVRRTFDVEYIDDVIAFTPAPLTRLDRADQTGDPL